jgi:hypothetical protein
MNHQMDHRQPQFVNGFWLADFDLLADFQNREGWFQLKPLGLSKDRKANITSETLGRAKKEMTMHLAYQHGFENFNPERNCQMLAML